MPSVAPPHPNPLPLGRERGQDEQPRRYSEEQTKGT
jgi:hypothetical protein